MLQKQSNQKLPYLYGYQIRFNLINKNNLLNILINQKNPYVLQFQLQYNSIVYNILKLSEITGPVTMLNQNTRRNYPSKQKQKTTNILLLNQEPQKQKDKNKEKISSKSLKLQFDQIQQKLKDRDIPKASLQSLITDQLFNHLKQSYLQHISLTQQIARILLQIYSHYPIRTKLYPSSTSNNFSYYAIPILLHNYGSVNQEAAVQCVEGLVTVGGLDIIGNLSKIQFIMPGSEAMNDGPRLQKNIKEIVKKWGQNPNSIFMNGLLRLLVDRLSKGDQPKINQNDRQNNYSQPKNKAESKKMSQQMPEKVLIQKNQFSLSQKVLIQITLRLTKLVESYYSEGNIVLNNESKSALLSVFKLFLENQSIMKKIDVSKATINGNSLHLLIYRWAVLSSCNYFSTLTIKNKATKHKNCFKQVFMVLMNFINDSAYKPKQQIQDNHQLMDKNNVKDKVSNSIHIMLNFLFCLAFPYSVKEPGQIPTILKDEYKLIVLINYSDLFLYLLTNINVQDMIRQNCIEAIVKWLFELAVFCDQFKKKHKLLAILASIESMGILESPTQLDFQSCQSILYRILIAIEKHLPHYPLRHYQKLYINKPGIFHLHFVDQLLKARQSIEVTVFFIELIERWVGVEMRDFNMLGYVCKFVGHYLRAKNDGGEGFRALLTFMKQLSPEALAFLNTVFYEASFSDQPSPQYTNTSQPAINPHAPLSPRLSTHQQSNPNSISRTKTHNPIHNHPHNQLQPIQPPTLTCTLPPLTLSYLQQESQIKSCGFSYLEKSIYIDRNFYNGKELEKWAPILNEVLDEQYYYHCKYFYYLLTEAYNQNTNESRSKIIQEQKKQSKRKSQRHSFSKSTQGLLLTKKKDRIIEIWQQAIHKNKVTQIQSTYQILSCWSNFVDNITSQSGIECVPILSNSQLKKIVDILLENYEKLINLPNIYSQNWREAIKEMQTNNDLFENYKKEQGKIKNRQLYFLRCISKFFESVAGKLCNLVPKSVDLETVAEIVQKYSVYGGGTVCWMSMRVLSEKMSRNLFIQEATMVIRHGNGLSKMVRKKLELYRELIFSYIQQKSQRAVVPKSNSQFSQTENSQNSQKSIQAVVETELKLKMTHIFQQCITILSQSFVDQNNGLIPQNGFLKSQRQEVYNKMLALEILQEVYQTSLANKASMRLLLTLMGINSKQKFTASKNSKQKPFQKLRNTLVRILFRDANVLTKFERRLILHLRISCINWVASDKSLFLGQYFSSKKETYDLCYGLLSVKQVFVALWNFAVDSQVQIRIQVLNILTSVYKSDNYNCLQREFYLVGAILTLFSALEPRPKIKAYTKKIISTKWNQINQPDGTYLLGICLALGFLMFNSKFSMPCLDIFEAFCSQWAKGNKEIYYLLMCALDHIGKQSYRFRKVDMSEGKDCGKLGSDLKVYYMNVKSRRGWIKYNDCANSPIQNTEKSETILRHLRTSIAENCKTAKFLKSKKQVVINLDHFMTEDNLCLLEKIPQNEKSKGKAYDEIKWDQVEIEDQFANDLDIF